MTDHEQRRVFAKNLISYLEQGRLSQREVADSIGVSPQTFNTWCRGIAIPRMDKIQRLADYFNIDKSDLIDPPQSASSASLSPEERQLLHDYRQLNEDGQEKVTEYTSDLVASGRYKKRGFSGSVEDEKDAG